MARSPFLKAAESAIRNQRPTGSGGRPSGSSSSDDDREPRPYLGGVPEDYQVPTGRAYNLSGMGARAAEGWASQGAAHGNQIFKRPQFREGDQFTTHPLDPVKIGQLQEMMARAEILTDPYKPTVWDDVTASAWAVVLGQANQMGVSPEIALMRMTAAGPSMVYDPATGEFVPAGGGSGAGAAPPQLVTRVTDPKVLESIFRRASIDIRGIGWDREHVQMATAAYNDMERMRQKQEYDAQLAAGQLGEMTGGAGPQAQEVVTIPTPEGWFDSYIREKDPEAVAEQEALNHIDAFMQLAGGTSWGVGRQL